MATDISTARTTDMSNTLAAYSVAALTPEGATGAKETEYINSKFTQQFGYYKKIPELKKAIDALAIWTVGKGYTADPETTIILNHIIGWGEDTFNSILNNMVIIKKISGDAFAEIIRDKESGELINIKVLDPSTVKIIANKEGKILRYEQTGKLPQGEKFKPNEILHFSNNRVADEIHGVSEVDACEWVILARNEAMEDQKKLMHRNVKPIVVWKTDTDDTSKMKAFQAKVDEAVNKAENLVIPKDAADFSLLTVPPNATLNPMPWIEYLENFFYQAVGVPKVILGGSQEFTEASSKIAYLTFEQVYLKEQREIEDDIWNQIYMRIKLQQPASLRNEMLSSEAANTGQVGFQPNDTTINSGKA